MNVQYPDNIHDYWRPLEHTGFKNWAFGVNRPRNAKEAENRWNILHPEYPMDEEDVMYTCICKMIYIYEKTVGRMEPLKLPPSVLKYE